MIVIQAMAAANVLLLVLFTNHIEVDDMTRRDAKDYCTLATPEVNFTDIGYTVDLNLDGLDYREDDIILTGYSQVFRAFQYTGCNAIKEENHVKKVGNSGDIGMCYSACKTQYIGIGEEDSKMACYCYEGVPERNTEHSCDLPCNENKLHVCGGKSFVSVYKYVTKSIEQADNTTCLAFYPILFSSGKAVWKNCNTKLRATCQDMYGEIDPKGLIFAPGLAWRDAMELCLRHDEYPITEEQGPEEGYTRGKWMGQISARCLITDSPTPTGFLQRSGSNSTFVLKFDVSKQFGRALCVKNSTYITDIVTGVDKGNTIGPRSSSDFTDITIQSVHVTERTDITSSSYLHHEDKIEDGKNSNLDTLYIAVPALFLVVVSMIAFVLLMRRRRRKMNTPDDSAYEEPSQATTGANQIHLTEGRRGQTDVSEDSTYEEPLQTTTTQTNVDQAPANQGRRMHTDAPDDSTYEEPSQETTLKTYVNQIPVYEGLMGGCTSHEYTDLETVRDYVNVHERNENDTDYVNVA